MQLYEKEFRNVISSVLAKGYDSALHLQQPVSSDISGDGAVSRWYDLVNPNDKTRWRFAHRHIRAIGYTYM